MFLYISNEESENEIKETIPFIIASQKIKYLRINLAWKNTRLVHWKQQNAEGIKEDLNKWKTSYVYRLEVNIV